MIRKATLCTALALLLFSALFAKNYTFESTPEWVVLSEIPKESTFSKYDITSGFYLKLVDYQVNLAESAYYNREVRNVISYSGITNASQLMVTYDTSYQHLKIHHLYIWRKGKKIDRTGHLSLEIMNNEYNLQQGIYTGTISAYDNLNDIRKDDLIDFSYTLEGKNPIFDDGKYLALPLEALNPIDLYTVRVLYPKDKNYGYKCVDCDSLLFTEKIEDEYHIIEIKHENSQALKLEENIPTWLSPYKYFTLSSYSSWADVNVWAQGVFALAAEPNLEIVYEEIFSGEEQMEDKINKIIDFVQDDIRYMGIESGIGSIKPFPPEQVVEQRFGDCKDKSLLLVSLLKQIGVEKAYPVLVNTMLKSEVGRYFPSSEVFNHCIVMFEYDNDTIWVDPTIAMQGGDFRDIYCYDMGKALVIGHSADSILEMNLKISEAKADITEEFIMKSFTEPANLKISSKRNGFEADSRRAMMEYYSLYDVSEWVTKDLKLHFPEVYKTSDVEIIDEMENNTFQIDYEYEVNGFWQDGDKGTNEAAKDLWIFRFEPQTLYQYFNVSVCEDRNFDYELAFPQNLHYRVIFHFPADLMANDYFNTTDNEAFYFEEKAEQIDLRTLQIDYRFATKTNHIKASDYKKICEQKNEIAKKLPIIIYFPK